MKKIIALFLVLFATVSSAIPLQTWPDWVATAPFIARQVPPSALVARGIGTSDYYVIEVDPTTGGIPVVATIAIDYSGATGAAVPAEAAYVGGVDSNGDLQGISTTTAGVLKSTFAAAPATTLPPESALIAGEDPSNVLRNITVDNSGRLVTVVQSSALPSGAATSALQTTGNNFLATIDADTGLISSNTTTISSNIINIDNKLNSLGQKLMGGSVPVTLASDQSAINVNLPTDAATATLQTTQNNNLTTIVTNTGTTATNTGTTATNTGTIVTNTGTTATNTGTTATNTGTIVTNTGTTATNTTNIDTKIPAQGQAVMASSMPVVIASNQSAIPVTQSGTWNVNNVLSVINFANLDYSSSNVTTSGYVQIVASTASAITAMTSFEGSGQGMILATGAASFEVDLLYIPPGGIDGQINVSIPAGVRLSLRAITATANSGRFIANFMGP